MPLLSHNPVGAGFLAVWRREEPAGQLLCRLALTPPEQACYEAIAHPSRREEWLAWHLMLRQTLGESVSADYAADGHPVLRGHAGHISVSHSRDFVVLYHQPGRCGVDIEDFTRDFVRTSGRFISPAERLLDKGSDERFPAVVWCAKEAVYKYAGRPGLDLLRDIRIDRFGPERSEIHATLLEEESILLKYRFLDRNCLVYTSDQ